MRHWWCFDIYIFIVWISVWITVHIRNAQSLFKWQQRFVFIRNWRIMARNYVSLFLIHKRFNCSSLSRFLVACIRSLDLILANIFKATSAPIFVFITFLRLESWILSRWRCSAYEAQDFLSISVYISLVSSRFLKIR